MKQDADTGGRLSEMPHHASQSSRWIPGPRSLCVRGIEGQHDALASRCVIYDERGFRLAIDQSRHPVLRRARQTIPSGIISVLAKQFNATRYPQRVGSLAAALTDQKIQAAGNRFGQSRKHKRHRELEELELDAYDPTRGGIRDTLRCRTLGSASS